MKARPSIAVCSLETLYFPFNYSPCSLPPPPHPHRSSWLPTAYVAPSPSVPLVFFFFFLCLRCTKPAGGGRGEGRRGGGNGILDGLGEAGLPASTFAALE